MIKANPSHKERCIEILSKSFDSNKNVDYVVKQDKRRIARIKSLMEYTFDYHLKAGDIYLSKNGCVVIAFKKNPGFILTIRLTLRLIFGTIGLSRLLKVLNWKSKVNKFLPKSSFMYIDFIGVLPENQRNGEGSELLKKVIERSKELSLPIYLVTSMPENLPFYNLYNFEVYKEIVVNHRIYLLRRLNLKYIISD